MSASPANSTPGRTANGTLPPIKRRPKPADPLVRPKKRLPRSAQIAPNGAGGVPVIPQSTAVTIPKPQQPSIQRGQSPRPGLQEPSLSLHAATETIHSGFSSAPLAEYQDFPLFITKQALKEGLRHHVARFASKKSIDLTDEKEFTRPLRLHRRDARAPAPGAKETKDGIVDEEREKQELLRAERDANREAEMAEVAPAMKTVQKRGGAKAQKTQQVYRNDETDKQKAASKLRYEEALPWHLDDFDNKQMWVGSYEAALSETYAQMVFRDGKFFLTPLEKWYKFTPKVPMTVDADVLMKTHMKKEKESKEPRWFQEHMAAQLKKAEDERNRRATNKLYVGRLAGEEDIPAASRRGRRDEGGDDIDFEEDFADDEAPPAIEGEVDDIKEAEERIKKDQLQANFFDLKDEKSYDKAENLDRKEKEEQKLLGKRVRKALKKREKNYIYDTDSDNPYSNESESSDTETERIREERAKKVAEEKQGGDKQKKDPPSSISAKGSITPSQRSSKHLDLSQRTVSSKSLKRAGSPNLSEVSGNESSRKKIKKHNQPSRLGAGITTPGEIPSRPHSPVNTSSSLAPTRSNDGNQAVRNSRAGSGSDSEGLQSGAERKGRKTKPLDRRSPKGSPRASRAVSPERDAASGGSRNAVVLPTLDELRGHIPTQGIPLHDLLKKFQLGDRKGEFVTMVKSIATYDKATKILRLK